MTSSEIRASFLDFFREKQHTIVPSSPLLPDAPNLLFTNAGMNQFVPIFLAQTPCPYRPARAADTQKCIRAGGKHNDLEDVGFDTYHHTFFEMLGNWSFGDYFKKEAIAWAWELVVGRWDFPASRLYATVYRPGPGDPSTFDQEAHDEWARIFIAAGLDPAIHIVNGNKQDNFWMMGDTGPCGPCSELHVDLTPGPRELDLARQRAGRELVNQGNARCIEIWNLVFIQFNANPDGTFGPLPARHVDTGMGFERVVSMIQGTDGMTNFETAKISNYETDVFRPIFDELEKITGKKYGSTLPASAQNESEQEKVDVAFRVIADHIRTLSFSIADGIQPSNEGRGYVLRRILRRAVRYGRNLGLREAFLGKLVPVLGATMGHIFPEVVKQADLIQRTLANEEESFLRNLERGVELFELFAQLRIVTIGNKKFSLRQRPASPNRNEREFYISGEVAFLLYDTFGFPLDLTELMARERGWAVDVAEFKILMEEQRARSQAAQKKEQIKVDAGYGDSSKQTEFVGYGDNLKIEIPIAGVLGGSTDHVHNKPMRYSVYFDKTVFFAEMGGQVGDTGVIECKGISYVVQGTQKAPELPVVMHILEKAILEVPGTPAFLRVDEARRHKIEAHHSGTHLLHWALRKVLGNTVTQKGSYVGPDRLRFDFSHGAAMTPEQIAEVERLVNDQVAADVSVKWEERRYAEVKGDPSILQFFGDKYGEKVRVVSIGDFSRELCGGTHVRQSSRVGYFKIISEGAIAAGIRRIEAASGEGLLDHLREEFKRHDEQLAGLQKRSPEQLELPAFADSDPATAWKTWEAREVYLRQVAAEIAQHEKDSAKRLEAGFQKLAVTEALEILQETGHINGIPFLIHHAASESAAFLPFLADALGARWQGVALLTALEGDKVACLCKVAPAYTKRVQAGKIIQALAPLIGGKGGGRPELAQGGGNNPAGIPLAMEKFEEILHAAT